MASESTYILLRVRHASFQKTLSADNDASCPTLARASIRTQEGQWHQHVPVSTLPWITISTSKEDAKHRASRGHSAQLHLLHFETSVPKAISEATMIAKHHVIVPDGLPEELPYVGASEDTDCFSSDDFRFFEEYHCQPSTYPQ